MLGIMAQLSTSCVNGDPETEAALEGVWKTSLSMTESGISMVATSLETYTLSDHQFHTEVTMRAGYPINARLCTVTYSGTWVATKEILYQDIDKNSITFSFNNALLDSEDKEEFKNDFLEDLKKDNYSEGMRFKSPITDTFEAEDDEGTHFTYTRQS